MKPSLDKEIEETLKSMNQNLRLKPEYEKQLRHRVINSPRSAAKKSYKRIWLSVAASIALLVSTSPLYSPTMAALAAKVFPLEIKANHNNPDTLTAEITKIVEESGYEFNSIGSTPNPFSIHLSLMKGNESLSTMTKVLEPKIEDMLSEKGIDQYELAIDLYEEREVVIPHETDDIMEQLSPVITEAFKVNGVSNSFTSYGLKPIGDSYELLIDIPDHLDEADGIRQHVVNFIEKEKLNVTDVIMDRYNLEHRNRDSRWGTISSDIYHALAGKSIYNVTGLSYKVKDGKATVNIKTALKEEPAESVSTEITDAINEYLHSASIREQIKNDEYEINLLSKDKEVLLEIKN